MNDLKDQKRLPAQRRTNLPLSTNFPVQLPIWPDPVRGGPNALLRSALFAGILSKRRQVLAVPNTKPDVEPEGVVIAAQDGINLRFAGTQLNQYDADVFFEALHRARRHPLETECLFTGHDFLKAIGRSHGKNEYVDLDNSLRRLTRGTVDIEWKANGRTLVFTGSLISHYVRDLESKLYKVAFAKEVRTLFAPASWTQLEWEERLTLKGQPLAQWLHSYFSTHAAPFPVSTAYLHEKSGSPTTLLKHFKSELKKSFVVMHERIGWETSWKGDLVTVRKPPSGAQSRYLARTAERRQRAIKAPASRRDNGDMSAIGDLIPGLVKSLKRS